MIFESHARGSSERCESTAAVVNRTGGIEQGDPRALEQFIASDIKKLLITVEECFCTGFKGR